MKTSLFRLAGFVSLVACAAAPIPKPAPPSEAPSTTTSTPAPTSDTNDTTDAFAPSAATSTKESSSPPDEKSTAEEPEFSPTAPDQLKTITKVDLGAAQKSVKANDEWGASIAKLEKKLGPPTYIVRSLDAEASYSNAFQWSAMRKDGGCYSLWVQQSPDKKSVVALGIDSMSKDDTTLPSKPGGEAINSCTGWPRSK
jgi:hypothetical protein